MKVICSEAKNCHGGLCNHRKPHNRIGGNQVFGRKRGCDYDEGCIKIKKPACVEWKESREKKCQK